MNMRCGTTVGVAILALLAGGAAAVRPAPAGAQARAVVWNLPHVAAPSYYHTQNLNAFAAKVKEKSQGRMEIRVHPASSLYPGPELIPAILDGRAEIGPVLSAYLTDVMLELGVLELPFMTSTLEEHRKAAEQLRGFAAEVMARRGLRLLTVHAWPSQQLFSNQPLRTLADWRGRKLRVYGAESADLVRTLGGAPVNIPFGEVYVALQRGVVDGAMTSATNAEPMKFFEVSRYLNYWSLLGAGCDWIVVNQKAWEALPRDLQQVVQDALKESRLEDRNWEEARAWEARARQRVQELGMTVVDPAAAEIDKARQLSRAVWEGWLRRAGPDGKRAMDTALRALGRRP
jgi:TRAP-type C4-dicarboxylate transport system substrate-binding protein